MEISQIKDFMISRPDLIEKVLEDAGYNKIERKKDKYWCGLGEDTGGTTIYVSIDTLAACDFPRGVKGDIITLIENKLQLGFNGTIKWICNSVGLEYTTENIKIYRPFGGYYMECDENKKDRIELLEEYPREILNKYHHH